MGQGNLPLMIDTVAVRSTGGHILVHGAEVDQLVVETDLTAKATHQDLV